MFVVSGGRNFELIDGAKNALRQEQCILDNINVRQAGSSRTPTWEPGAGNPAGPLTTC